MSSLISRLKREFLRNPKKTGILGVMFLVAIYFWAPLVSEWFGTPSTTPQAATDVTGPLATTAQSTPTAIRRRSTTHSWDALVEATLHDPLMQTTQLAANSRDPFVALAPLPAPDALVDDETAMAAEPEAVKALPITPETLGLTLTSTIVGKLGGVATINGRSYRQGDEIELPSDSASDGKPFTILKVLPSRVTLARNEQEYEIELQRTRLSNGDQVKLVGHDTSSR